jgi:hypothetical protein
MTWEKLCSHGDDEATVRGALLDQFDADWPEIGRSVRAQLLEQGCDMAMALEVTERARQVFRADAADRAPRVLDAMAASASPRH